MRQTSRCPILVTPSARFESMNINFVSHCFDSEGGVGFEPTPEASALIDLTVAFGLVGNEAYCINPWDLLFMPA